MVFVSMTTKAVHVDAISDYNIKVFLATSRRVISWRGLCSDIYTDCGTNFQDADKELRASSRFEQPAEPSTRSSGTSTPRVTSLRGPVEAAVKSTKHDIRPILGKRKLTYEDTATFLSQIEACLFVDAQELATLTPGHLLIGSAVNALPEPTLLDLKLSRLSCWQLLVKVQDQF